MRNYFFCRAFKYTVIIICNMKVFILYFLNLDKISLNKIGIKTLYLTQKYIKILKKQH